MVTVSLFLSVFGVSNSNDLAVLRKRDDEVLASAILSLYCTLSQIKIKPFLGLKEHLIFF